ncbi:MAG TPA: hypothetical protein VFW46_16275 [Stellaceae bacterium]|nr:hypothetical protein [Stellaceae bacterium]
MTSKNWRRVAALAAVASIAAGACSPAPAPADYSNIGVYKSFPRYDYPGPALRGSPGS